jgi:hypothetical protein
VPNLFACQALKNTTPFAAFQPHFCLRLKAACATPQNAYNGSRKRISIAKKNQSKAGVFIHPAQSNTNKTNRSDQARRRTRSVIDIAVCERCGQSGHIDWQRRATNQKVM